MAVQRTSRSGLFLLELMIVILFFAVTSAICMNLFVKAHLTSTAGSDLTAAVRETQSAAEWFKAVDGDKDQLADRLSAHVLEERLGLYFDKDWVRTGEGNAVSTVSILFGGQRMDLPDGTGVEAPPPIKRDCLGALVIAWSEKGEIFRIPVEKYPG